MAKKTTNRKAFNFYKSYFDVYSELSDKDKVKFMDALLNKQFYDIEPTLTGIAKFAYISQKHSIDVQVKGYKDKTKSELHNPYQGGMQGGIDAPSVQEKEEGKEKEKEEGKGKVQVVFPFETKEFREFWNLWKEYKLKEHRFKYKSVISEQAALKKLSALAKGNQQNAIAILEDSMANGYQGFFELKNNIKNETDSDKRKEVFANYLRKVNKSDNF